MAQLVTSDVLTPHPREAPAVFERQEALHGGCASVSGRAGLTSGFEWNLTLPFIGRERLRRALDRPNRKSSFWAWLHSMLLLTPRFTPSSKIMLNQKQYFIREHVGLLKLSDAYDILEPESHRKLGLAREEISALVKILRFLIDKRLMPTTIRVYEGADESTHQLLFSIRRGVALFRPRVDVLDASGKTLGYLKSKAFSLGGAFRVFSATDQEIALVQGDWKGWNFRFLSGDVELGVITKKWAGLGKELFTSADNYIISITAAPDPSLNLMLLAAGLAVDTVLKESD